MSAPVNHDILDLIYDEQVRGFYPGQRESECVEFLDLVEMQWYEIVVRPIDGPDR